MAKIFITNKDVIGNVVIGTKTFDFSKHYIILDDTVDADTIERIRSFNPSLGYNVYTTAEFKEKFIQKNQATKAPQTPPTPPEGTKEIPPVKDPEEEKRIWQEKQEKVTAQKEILKTLKKEFDEISDEDENAETLKSEKLEAITEAENKLRELQA